MDDLDTLDTYCLTLSRMHDDLGGDFACIASPTLSKQESVTGLFESIVSRKEIRWFDAELCKSLLLFLPKLLLKYITISFWAGRYRTKSLPKGAVIFRSFLVPRALEGSKVVDEYFGCAPNDLKNICPVVKLLYSSNWKLLSRFARTSDQSDFFLSIGLLPQKKIFYLFLKYLFTAHVRLKKKYFVDGFDISKLVNRSLLLDYLQCRGLTAFAENFIMEEIVKWKPISFVYVYENQSWEKVCCNIAHRESLLTVGYQSSGFSKAFPNFFPNQIDFQRPHFPTRILTVGDGFRDLLIENGQFKSEVRSFCGLRFDYPSLHGRFLQNGFEPSLHRRILYAFPVHKAHYGVICKMLIEVFGGGDIEVHLKVHPLHSQEISSLFGSTEKTFTVVNDLKSVELSKTYDFVLFNDNSFGIEALMLGVRAYEFRVNNLMDATRLIKFDLWKNSVDVTEIANLKVEIEDGSLDKYIDSEEVEKYINFLYRPYSKSLLSNFLPEWSN